ncbi:hypothetical protein JOC77_002787 [Peribacillus deserti]|uniref:Uncharacterized protein n=1 Tax=Peribacillus deserti TaxID=673318 RepID=A0ABS2QJJ9_9BACI|nr:hypothetical protein [Peribacillus deserti]MBM7693347.1 hypothetical protein [Peribacillus deserti]
MKWAEEFVEEWRRLRAQTRFIGRKKYKAYSEIKDFVELEKWEGYNTGCTWVWTEYGMHNDSNCILLIFQSHLVGGIRMHYVAYYFSGPMKESDWTKFHMLESVHEQAVLGNAAEDSLSRMEALQAAEEKYEEYKAHIEKVPDKYHKGGR